MSVLYVPPEAPLIVHVAAGALLFAHIGGGSVGMASGSVAILASKGGRLHRVAGKVFFVAMLFMTGVATTVSPFLDGKFTNTTAGFFTFYLILTGWWAVKRPAGQVGIVEKAALVLPLAIIAGAISAAILTVGTPRAAAFAVIYPFALVAALAAVCDVIMIRRGGVMGAPRVRRHLWRMSTALAVALGSFFLGQQKFLPEMLRGNPLMAAPMVIALALMAFWLVRYSFPKLFRRRPIRAAVSVAGQPS